MTIKRLDRSDSANNTVNVVSTKLTTFTMSNALSLVQLVTRVGGINLSGTIGNNFGISAIVTGTFGRAGAGGPAIIGSVVVSNLAVDSGLSGCVLTYSVSSNDISFEVTGVSSTTIRWLAMTRPLYWVP